MTDDRVAKLEEAVRRLSRIVVELCHKNEGASFDRRVWQWHMDTANSIAAEFKQTGDADEQCQHEWKESISSDSEIGGDRTYVKCVRCGVPGERNDKTGDVYYPAT